jgi:hypothetical protein
MPGFILRKGQRLKTFATMRYFGDGVAGEGIIQDLSLIGSSLPEIDRSPSGWCSPCIFLCREMQSCC